VNGARLLHENGQKFSPSCEANGASRLTARIYGAGRGQQYFPFHNARVHADRLALPPTRDDHPAISDLEGTGVNRTRVLPFAAIRNVVSGAGLFAVLVWGASFAATRAALESFNPWGLVGLRLWVGALLLLILGAAGGSMLPQRADLPRCTFLGLVLSVHLLIQAYGLRFTSAVHTGWIIGFIPAVVALGAHVLGKQRIKPLGWDGIALGTGGILVVWLSKSPDFAHAQFGDLLQIVSCLTWAVYTLAAVEPVLRSGALPVTAFGMAVAAVVMSIAMIFTGWRSGPAVTRDALLAVAFLGPICSGVAYYAWFAAQRVHGPARVNSLIYAEPFVSLATGALLLNEQVTGSAILGGICVVLGVWLVARGSRKPTPRPTSDSVFLDGVSGHD
jgi:drug/metabolite transporter (DMT)-like permease